MPIGKAVGQAIFKRLAPEMMSAASMIRVAKKYAGTYRKTDMLADIRKYTGRVKYQLQISEMPSDLKVPKAWIGDVLLKEPGANYRIFGKAKFYDFRTGDVYEKTVSFYHTDHLMKKTYAMHFNEYFKYKYREDDMELLSFEQTSMEHNEGKPW